MVRVDASLPLARLLMLAAALPTRALGKLTQLLGRRHSVPVEVLIAERGRRRALERDLRAALARLRRTVGSLHLMEVAVVAQHVIRTDRELAGCYQTAWRQGGVRFALLRLALQVNGRELGTDELLAVLAEQYIGLALEQSVGTSLLVPVELETPETRPTGRITVFRPSPLTPSKNAANSGA